MHRLACYQDDYECSWDPCASEFVKCCEIHTKERDHSMFLAWEEEIRALMDQSLH